MRSISHWTPRYVLDRLTVYAYEKRHPEKPWLTRDPNRFLEDFIRPTDVGLELGSGRSTVWIGRRVHRLHSIETNAIWAERVRGMIAESGLENVVYREIHGSNESELAGMYESAFVEIPNATLDFCLVDGDCRDRCALLALPKLRPGGVLIIDNVNRYLPSISISPASRSLVDGADGQGWLEVEAALCTWRRYWTSSGVTDTAIFFKPSIQIDAE